MRERHREILEFAAEYTAQMLGCGTHTSRVVRCVTRICESLGARVEISTTMRHLTICVCTPDGSTTRVVSVPAMPINFRLTTDLTAP